MVGVSRRASWPGPNGGGGAVFRFLFHCHPQKLHQIQKKTLKHLRKRFTTLKEPSSFSKQSAHVLVYISYKIYLITFGHVFGVKKPSIWSCHCESHLWGITDLVQPVHPSSARSSVVGKTLVSWGSKLKKLPDVRINNLRKYVFEYLEVHSVWTYINMVIWENIPKPHILTRF